MIVRIAGVQYLLRQIDDWSGFENQVRFIMKAAGDYKPQFVVVPEIFTTQLLSFMDTSNVNDAVRNLHEYTDRYKALMSELAAQWDVHLIGGSRPTIHADGRLLNTACYFTPNGEIHEQDKIHRTRWERETWNTDAGDRLRLFDTPFGKIAILICYDIEFPELSRMVCEAGADILFVPSCTDDRQGFFRVRYCSTHAPSRTRFSRCTPAPWATWRSKVWACTMARQRSSRRRISRLRVTALPPKARPTSNRSWSPRLICVTWRATASRARRFRCWTSGRTSTPGRWTSSRCADRPAPSAPRC